MHQKKRMMNFYVKMYAVYLYICTIYNFLSEQNICRQTTDKHINEELVSNHGEIIAPPKRYKKNTCKIETTRLKQLNEVVLTETKCLKKNNTNMDVIQEYTNCIQDEIER